MKAPRQESPFTRQAPYCQSGIQDHRIAGSQDHRMTGSQDHAAGALIVSGCYWGPRTNENLHLLLRRLFADSTQVTFFSTAPATCNRHNDRQTKNGPCTNMSNGQRGSNKSERRRDHARQRRHVTHTHTHGILKIKIRSLKTR